jgi:hypothetical protein
MALDRTWYNTLVDDAGDGMSGSVWDKADVDSLMDAIDAEIARLEGRIIHTGGAWIPRFDATSGASGQVYASQSGQYLRVGNLVTAWAYFSLSVKGTFSGPILIAGLPYPSSGAHGYYAGLVSQLNNLATTWVSFSAFLGGADSRAYLLGRKTAAVSSTTVDQADLTNSTDCIFSISYLVS